MFHRCMMPHFAFRTFFFPALSFITDEKLCQRNVNSLFFFLCLTLMKHPADHVVRTHKQKINKFHRFSRILCHIFISFSWTCQKMNDKFFWRFFLWLKSTRHDTAYNRKKLARCRRIIMVTLCLSIFVSAYTACASNVVISRTILWWLLLLFFCIII